LGFDRYPVLFRNNSYIVPLSLGVLLTYNDAILAALGFRELNLN